MLSNKRCPFQYRPVETTAIRCENKLGRCIPGSHRKRSCLTSSRATRGHRKAAEVRDRPLVWHSCRFGQEPSDPGTGSASSRRQKHSPKRKMQDLTALSMSRPPTRNLIQSLRGKTHSTASHAGIRSYISYIHRLVSNLILAALHRVWCGFSCEGRGTRSYIITTPANLPLPLPQREVRRRPSSRPATANRRERYRPGSDPPPRARCRTT